jgi:hypothetical protein
MGKGKMTKKTNSIELVHIPLKEDDLFFYKSFVKDLGGVKNARILLLDIIDRFFRSQYFDPDLLDELGITLREKENIWIETKGGEK